MSYSAEAWTLYDNNVKEFGADVDIREFWEVYLKRDEAFRIRKPAKFTPKIPRGMDLNFLPSKSGLERQIQELISEWNGRKLGEIEVELDAQRTRLATAEAKLAKKETKAALNEQRIAGNKIKQIERWIADAKRTKMEPAKDNRIFPDWYVPVLISENGLKVVRPMRYHCRPAGMEPSIDWTKDGCVSGTYNARRDNLQCFWRNQFGYTHGLMLAETFYENVDDGKGGSKEIQFRPRTGETIFIACLYSHWLDPEGRSPTCGRLRPSPTSPNPKWPRLVTIARSSKFAPSTWTSGYIRIRKTWTRYSRSSTKSATRITYWSRLQPDAIR